MVVVAREKQGVEPEGALTQNGSGSLEKLHKDGSERQRLAAVYTHVSSHGGLFLRHIKPNTQVLFTWGEEGGGRGLQFPGAPVLGLRACRDAAGPWGSGAWGHNRGRRVPWDNKEGKEGCDSELSISMCRGWGWELPYGPMSQEALYPSPLGFPSLGSLGLCSLTGCDDVPRTQQLQVREDVNEVSHACVAVDPGPQDTGSALLGPLAQPQLCLVAHDQGRCGIGNIRLQLQEPGSTTPRRPAVTHRTGTSRRAPGRPSLCRSGT